MPRQLGWQISRVACFKFSEFQFSGHFTASPGECELFSSIQCIFIETLWMSHDLSLISVKSECSFFLTKTLELRSALGGCRVRGDTAPSSADGGWRTGFPVEETSTEEDSLVIGH